MSLPYPVSPPMMGDNSATAAAILPGDIDNRPSYYPGTTEPMVTMVPATTGYPQPYPGWPQQEYPQQSGYPGYPAAPQYPPEQPAQYPGYAPHQQGYPPPPPVPGYPPQDPAAYPVAASYLQYPQNTYDPRNGFTHQIWHS